MRVSKYYLGKEVRMQWKDPTGGSRELIKDAPKGEAALAHWIERGLVDDITDGVVRLRQSEAFNAGADLPDEATFSYVPEVLIEKLEVAEFKEHSKEGGE